MRGVFCLGGFLGTVVDLPPPPVPALRSGLRYSPSVRPRVAPARTFAALLRRCSLRNRSLRILVRLGCPARSGDSCRSAAIPRASVADFGDRDSPVADRRVPISAASAPPVTRTVPRTCSHGEWISRSAPRGEKRPVNSRQEWREANVAAEAHPAQRTTWISRRSEREREGGV